MRNALPIYAGFLIPVVFWLTIVTCGLLTVEYSHLTNMVSELGAKGTRTQYIFTVGLVFSSLLSIVFVVGLYRMAKEVKLNAIPILMILTFSISIFGAAIFPLPSRLHGIVGSPSMLLPLSPLLTMLLWKNKTIPNIELASGLIFLIMILGFSTLIPNVMDNYFGLKQRFFHIGWSIWFVYLAYEFLRLQKKVSLQESPAISNK